MGRARLDRGHGTTRKWPLQFFNEQPARGHNSGRGTT